MRVTLALDDDLVTLAQEYTGVSDETVGERSLDGFRACDLRGYRFEVGCGSTQSRQPNGAFPLDHGSCKWVS